MVISNARPEEKSHVIDSAMIQNSDENSSFSSSSVSDSDEEEEDDDDMFQSGFVLNGGKIKSFTPFLAKGLS